MPSRIWSHLCDYATIDSGGKPTIIGEFDRIFCATVPATHPLLCVISKWSGNEGETFTEQVKIISSNRSEIAASAINTVTIDKAAEGIGTHTAINLFMMVEFPGFGEYSIEILVNNIPVHILALHITQVPTQPP